MMLASALASSSSGSRILCQGKTDAGGSIRQGGQSASVVDIALALPTKQRFHHPPFNFRV
jgi:hypothetical protein